MTTRISLDATRRERAATRSQTDMKTLSKHVHRTVRCSHSTSHSCLPKHCSCRECKFKLMPNLRRSRCHGHKNSTRLKKKGKKNFVRGKNLKFPCTGKVKAHKINPTTVNDVVQMNWPYPMQPHTGEWK